MADDCISVGKVELIAKTKAFSCDILRFSHVSPSLGGLETKWHAIVPQTGSSSSDTAQRKLPVLYWLSGLTCTDENFVQKAGAARDAATHQMAIIAPDTSPRGAGCKDEETSYDFGTGAGFYVDSTNLEYSHYYRMYTYILKELPLAVSKVLGLRIDISRSSIFGHSMGGHGALVLALRNPQRYKSVSAFAPICHPSECPWGIKCLGSYLGDKNKTNWSQYDATDLVSSQSQLRNGPCFDDILIDQGTEDGFYKEKQLLPEDFAEACKSAGQKVRMRLPFFTQYISIQEYFRDCMSLFFSPFAERHIFSRISHEFVNILLYDLSLIDPPWE